MLTLLYIGCFSLRDEMKLTFEKKSNIVSARKFLDVGWENGVQISGKEFNNFNNLRKFLSANFSKRKFLSCFFKQLFFLSNKINSSFCLQ